MAHKPGTRQRTVAVAVAVPAPARATATTLGQLKTSSEKAKSVLTRRSSRISKTNNVHDPKDENVVKVEGTERSLKKKENAKSATPDETGSEEGVEKENVPPPAAQKANNSNQQLETRIETEGNKNPAQAPMGRKRKWSRPTRVVKLDVQEHDDVDSQYTSQDDNDDASKDDSDGEYKDGESSSSRESAPSAVKMVKPRQGREPEMSEYERQRLENIKRNQEILQLLELPTAATELQVASLEGRQPETKAVDKDSLASSPAPVRIQRQYTKPAPKIIQPARISNRLRGIAVKPLEVGENDTIANRDDAEKDGENTENEDEEDTSSLMSGDLFFDKETREKAIRVDGHYRGWLNPEVVEKYGFEKSAQEAWEANGGGTFSFKDPLGEAGTSKSKSSKRPRHDAKMVSKAMFKKNPNAYFYRHNEPGLEQWTGDWTEEEGEVFLKVAREHGCGDKWGLFASYIPHRVGYQCSNYYRQVVLPQGLVFDSNYEYTSRGKPIYCGKFNQRRD
ncbi:hypothetical protein B0O80DRAFT_498808 [Mortierella sp. GBAus27b]|nr:hypothetical protein BGX31_002478 [Mortierella sp. GBA43]KAI8353971.1 hypothetical protein B0O80DRAFT_498808 [Mortierella sp. GBAus27b]